ncbi:hypothetical protein BDQ12DRAFT_661487 [Crucibulum laeve]|uniref:Uncharacterized protein n=1 Tax=Crucibulum laeve TaxID=68775 RepID=A0A5C3MJH6_9AGAR|nr:hypothetical protein BDQ12DRAFT_661487 [Crucibulum laeve]
MLRSLTIVALVAYASAQSLSNECQSALLAIAADKDASACLSPGSLLPIATGSSNSSIVPTVNTWLTSLCSAAPCSNATIAAVVNNVTAGCSAEFGNSSSSSNAAVTSIIQQYYPTVRQVVCLKDGDTNCITQTLTNIEQATGTLSISNIFSIIANPPANIPSNISCTNCVKAAYNIIRKDFSSLVSDSDSTLQQQCGSSFTDGATPSGIVESAATSGAAQTTATGNTALGSVTFLSRGVATGAAASALVVISTALVFLA